jgi:NAD(P)-dependent dehydrogenase (short-subunit alcohol dehydrogenase family)
MATILVTGAARGIGLALAKAYATRGDSVLATCRAPSRALAALGVEVIEGIDVAQDECVARLETAVHGRPIDVAVNNAGVLLPEPEGTFDFASLRRQYETNALGPLRVTAAVRSSLRAGSKLVIVTSRMGSIGDNGSGGMYGYRMSKAAVNMAALNLAHELRSAGVMVGLLHPGMVATDMGAAHGVPVDEAAAMLVARIDELTPERSATFLHANGQTLPW